MESEIIELKQNIQKIVDQIGIWNEGCTCETCLNILKEKLLKTIDDHIKKLNY